MDQPPKDLPPRDLPNDPQPGRKKEDFFFRNPYLFYIVFKALIFGAGLFIAWLAWKNGWIAHR